MKKKLEAELISIAHRILQMKNKSDLTQLHQEAQKLYEKLSVLRFVEENLADVKPTIGYAALEDKLAAVFDNHASGEPIAVESESTQKGEAINEIISGISEKAGEQANNEMAEEEQEIEPIAELESPEEIVSSAEVEATQESRDEEKEEDETPEESPAAEPQKIEEPAETKEPPIKAETKQDDLFKPAFEWGFEPKEEPKTESIPGEAKITPAQISFDDLLGQGYTDPVFVKPEEVETVMPKNDGPSEDDRRAAELAESNKRLADLREAANKPLSERNESKNVIPISRDFNDTSNVISINKSENLNDRMSKGITIGLNDRIAFMKHLFNNSSEDYNRVLSQLITFDTLPEAKEFIDNMVKPDYNNWEGKDEYEQRFMEIVEKKFL